jgi:tetratricopeptide (TPR) repeat protein
MLKENVHRYTAWILFFVIAGAYLIMARYFPRLYILATYEDLIGEWAQVFLFTFTMLLAVRQAVISSKFRLYFSLLAFACLYVAGEEISWGQRLFDIPTPEFFDQHNLQGETNLHNFFTGPISTLTKQALEYVIAVGLAGYGLVYPWLLRRRAHLALWFEKKGLAAPPLYLWPFFVTSALLEIGLFQFNEAEIAEILIPFALAVMTLNYSLACRQQVSLFSGQGWDSFSSRRLAGLTALLFVGSVVLALGTTIISYESPRLGPEMVHRYVNGVEKFAGRYKRYKQWPLAVDLYLEVQQYEPNRASVQRNLFRCYDQLGQQERALQQLNRAIEIDHQRLETRPDSLSAHISLVRNYLLAENVEKTQDHLRQALVIGLEKKASNPNNPSTAYWLGRSYQLKGDFTAAYHEFERAVNLRPESLKYRKAMLGIHPLAEVIQTEDKS